MIYTIDELIKRIAPVAEKYKLNAVYLFGSYARGTATEDSDVDLLVDLYDSSVYESKMKGLYEDFHRAINKKIDLVTLGTLEHQAEGIYYKISQRIMRESVKVY